MQGAIARNLRMITACVAVSAFTLSSSASIDRRDRPPTIPRLLGDDYTHTDQDDGPIDGHSDQDGRVPWTHPNDPDVLPGTGNFSGAKDDPHELIFAGPFDGPIGGIDFGLMDPISSGVLLSPDPDLLGHRTRLGADPLGLGNPAPFGISNDSAMGTRDLPGLQTVGVPAPGALPLLALAMLVNRRRRRRRPAH